MVSEDKELKKIKTMLAQGIITQAEYTYLLESKKAPRPQKQKVPVQKSIFSFFLTLLGIAAVLFGTCIFNIAITNAGKIESAVIILTFVWPLVPLILFGLIAVKTKNPGIKWGVILFGLLVLLIFLAVWWVS